jgi:hypothetical protein
MALEQRLEKIEEDICLGNLYKVGKLNGKAEA